MDIGVSFPVVKRPGREAKHSTPSGVEVKNQFFFNVCSVCDENCYKFLLQLPKIFYGIVDWRKAFSYFLRIKAVSFSG